MTQEAGKSKEQQPFESYPELAEIIQKIAAHGLRSGTDWNKLLHEINALAEYAQQREQPWVRVEDEMPDHDRNVLACIAIPDVEDAEDIVHMVFLNHRGWMIQMQHGFPEPLTLGIVTHWMYAPPAPPKD